MFNGHNRSEGLLFRNTCGISVDAFEFGIGAVGASRPLAIAPGPTRMSDTELTELGSVVDGVAFVLPTPTGVTCEGDLAANSTIIAMRTVWFQAGCHGSRGSWLGGPAVDIRAEAGQRVPRVRSGSMQWRQFNSGGEDARCDNNGQVVGSAVWR